MTVIYNPIVLRLPGGSGGKWTGQSLNDMTESRRVLAQDGRIPHE